MERAHTLCTLTFAMHRRRKTPSALITSKRIICSFRLVNLCVCFIFKSVHFECDIFYFFILQGSAAGIVWITSDKFLEYINGSKNNNLLC